MTHIPPDDPDFAADDAADRASAAPLDAEVLASARAYHAPPAAVPAEAMWAAVQARRAAARAASEREASEREASERGALEREALGAGAAPPTLRVTRGSLGPDVRRRAFWRRASLAAAAVLLVGVGVGVGRYTASPDVESRVAQTPASQGAAPAADRVVDVAAAEPAPVSGAAGATLDGRRSDAQPGVAPAPAARRSTSADAERLVARAGGGAEHVPNGEGAPRAGMPAGAPARALPGASVPLRFATEQHLARAEALLAAFGASADGGAGSDVPRDATRDAPPDAAWARDLLTTTQLLLDSPAGRDPARRALLEDLELVLGQIARLPRADTPTERALIDRAIRRGDLLAKLRAGTPSAPPPAPPIARGT